MPEASSGQKSGPQQPEKHLAKGDAGHGLACQNGDLGNYLFPGGDGERSQLVAAVTGAAADSARETD